MSSVILFVKLESSGGVQMDRRVVDAVRSAGSRGRAAVPDERAAGCAPHEVTPRGERRDLVAAGVDDGHRHAVRVAKLNPDRRPCSSAQSTDRREDLRGDAAVGGSPRRAGS